MEKEYRVVFIDITNSVKSKLNPKVNGDNLSREMEAAMNELYREGYVWERAIDIDGHPSLMTEGYMLVFRKDSNKNG